MFKCLEYLWHRTFFPARTIAWCARHATMMISDCRRREGVSEMDGNNVVKFAGSLPSCAPPQNAAGLVRTIRPLPHPTNNNAAFIFSLSHSLSPLSPWKEGGPFISIEAILRCSKRSRNFSRVTQSAECQKRDEFHSILSFEAGGRTSAGNRCGNPSVRRTARK